MRLLSFNIQYGFGSDGIYDLSRAVRLFDGADMIALQEVERHWSRSGFDALFPTGISAISIHMSHLFRRQR